MLSLEVRGGLNNQRECVINGVLAAAELKCAAPSLLTPSAPL